MALEHKLFVRRLMYVAGDSDSHMYIVDGVRAATIVYICSIQGSPPEDATNYDRTKYIW